MILQALVAIGAFTVIVGVPIFVSLCVGRWWDERWCYQMEWDAQTIFVVWFTGAFVVAAVVGAGLVLHTVWAWAGEILR